jgi:membrane protein
MYGTGAAPATLGLGAGETWERCMTKEPKVVAQILVDSGKEFMEDACPRLSAALAYYAIFSLPPLLIVVVALLGLVLDPSDVRGELASQIESLIGPQAAEQVRTMIKSADSPQRGIFGWLGFAALLFGATAVMVQLQDALNKAWDVKPVKRSGVKLFIMKRMLSFAMILGVAFLLLISLVITAVITSFSRVITDSLPGDGWAIVIQVVNFAVTLAIVVALFAAMFKYLPDAKVEWSDVWIGAWLTAILFSIGKFVVGWYVGSRDLGDTYGAAGSLAVIMIWVYFSAMIFLFGAEFTQVWAKHHGHFRAPEPGAVTVENREDTADA